MKLTKKDISIINWIKDFYKQFNISLKILTKSYAGGQTDIERRRVLIPISTLRQSDTRILHVVMHELSHHLSYDHNKYANYYKIIYKNKITKKDIKLIRRIGLKAERYCDKMAEKLIKSFFKDLPCKIPQYSKSWYKKHYLDKYFPIKGVK